MAAKVLPEVVRSTICPRDMDKMLVAGMGDIVITNDGATIMKEMDVQNPAAKMLVEVAKTQDSEVGDGITTAVVLAGELLSGAESLLDGDVHPNVIIDGYRKRCRESPGGPGQVLRLKRSTHTLASALTVPCRLSAFAGIHSHQLVLQVIILSSVGIMNFHCQGLETGRKPCGAK